MPDTDVDQILSELDSASLTPSGQGGWEDGGEPSAEDAAPIAGQPVVETPAEPAANPDNWTLNVAGKEIVTDDREKIKQWAQQGYDYSQKVGEWNKEREGWNEERGRYTKYTEIDQFAQTNPDWWNHVEQSWNSRSQATNTDGQANPEVASLVNQELAPIKEFMQELQVERQETLTRQADEALRTEVQSIQEKYPNLDLNRVQPSGKTLDMEILDHATRNDIPSYKAAFMDYYGDNLLEMAKAQAKEEAMKELQQRNRSGVLGTSPTQQQQQTGQFAYNRGQSYTDLAKEALAELGITD
jgi:hypothetical protein